MFGFNTLVDRRKVINLTFYQQLVDDDIGSSVLFSMIDLWVLST